MDKNILEQYLELKEEIRDLQDRIDRDERRLEKIRKEGVVSDTVKGTRSDGTFGPIKITGYPIPEHNQVKNMIKKRVAKLHILEDDLQNASSAILYPHSQRLSLRSACLCRREYGLDTFHLINNY